MTSEVHEDYNALHTARRRSQMAVGLWRALYLLFLEELGPCHTMLEVGAGTPDFLLASPAARCIALDRDDEYRAEFEGAGIDFHCLDVDRDPWPDLPPVDVAVSSDVFEHLPRPDLALGRLASSLAPDGILFSHVPNEFQLSRCWPILMGRREAVLYHEGYDEWRNPHVHRFTDLGFQRFLALEFPHSVKLTEIYHGKWLRRLGRMGWKPPYTLQPGPTYVSTRDERQLERLLEIKHRLFADVPATRRRLRALRRRE